MSEVVTRFKAEAVSAPKHEDRVRALGCCVPGCRRTPVHSHHAKTKGAHGNRPENLVGLCWYHHVGPKGVHPMGRITWQRVHGVDLIAVSADNAAVSRAMGIL